MATMQIAKTAQHSFMAIRHLPSSMDFSLRLLRYAVSIAASKDAQDGQDGVVVRMQTLDGGCAF